MLWLALGCSASATSGPMPRSTGDSGSPGSAGTGDSGAPSSAGTNSTSGGAASAAGGAQSSGGTQSASTAGTTGSQGGASSGGKPSTGGSSGSGSTTTGSGGKCNSTGPNGEAFYDGFEDGEYLNCPEWIDADPTLGGMWSVKDDGGTQVLAQSATVSDLVFAVSGDYKLTDQTVSAKVKYTSSPGTVAIFARVQDARNFYYLYLDGSNLVLRGKVNNSSLTSVKVKTPTVEGTWYTLKLSVTGSTLTGSLNDTVMVTTTDTGIPSGGIGVGTNGAAAEFDDVTVTVP